MMAEAAVESKLFASHTYVEWTSEIVNMYNLYIIKISRVRERTFISLSEKFLCYLFKYESTKDN